MFYRCILGGGAGDSLSFQNGTKFSTFDKNNMQNTSTNCAQDTKGGWWFNDCQRKACLTGKYKNGIRWDSWKGSNETLSKIEMKVHPVWQNVNEHGNLGFLDNRMNYLLDCKPLFRIMRTLRRVLPFEHVCEVRLVFSTSVQKYHHNSVDLCPEIMENSASLTSWAHACMKLTRSSRQADTFSHIS